MEIKSRLKNIWVGVVENRCSYSGHRTLNLAVPQEGFNGIKWFFGYLYKISKAKTYFNIYWEDMVS